MTIKHEEMLLRIFAIGHEWWMDENDQSEYDRMMMTLFGAQMDEAIEQGIRNGYSAEQQERIASIVWKQLVSRGK